MVERGELMTICRQIGGMMEAGVDILRITRVLRAQTSNRHLLELFDELDHDLRMGRSLADAMERASDVFSPFMVSLVRQGEERNNIAGAFLKIADYLQQEEAAHADEWHSHHASHHAPPRETPETPVVPATSPLSSPLSVIALDGLMERLQSFGLRALTIFSGLLLSLAAVWLSVELGWLEYRWLNVTLYSVAALFMGASGVWLQRKIDADRRRGLRCSFCGLREEDGAELLRAPRFAGAAICGRCAAIAARRATGEASDEIPSEDNPSQAEQNASGAKPAPQAAAKGVSKNAAEPGRNGVAGGHNFSACGNTSEKADKSAADEEDYE